MKIRTLLMFAVLAVTGIWGINQSFASSSVSCDCDKVYVSPEQVVVSHEGIFVMVEGEALQVKAVMQDANGIYYLTPSIYWHCKNCGRANGAWRSYCETCGKHYSWREGDGDEDDD